MTAADLARLDDSSWALSGDLTLRTVPGLLQRLPAFGPGRNALSLEAVTRIDSTSIALLFLLARRARAAGGSLVFSGLPAELEAMARLYDVEALIGAGTSARSTEPAEE